MLHLFKRKKGKSVDLNSTPSNSSLWLYNPNSYEDTLPGYSQHADLFPPSAPPDETHPGLHQPEERPYDVAAELEIRTKMNITSISGIIGILEELLDQYSGSISYKPLIISNILIMAFHMTKKASDNSLNFYTSEIYYPISYHLSDKYPKIREKIDYALSTRFRRGKMDVFLNIKCKLTPTNKRGVPFHEIYMYPMSNGSQPPKFSEVSPIFGIITKLEQNKLIFN
ncbi:matrix [Hart Park virus]|uniref:Matrix protein n=1 Tax=Hart Park virus TaxID=200401 RepID=A0A0D3R194_9RHAB|nr:matrix [Hart Park virus]AJR28494.1 matrix [Hart Park virus]